MHNRNSCCAQCTAVNGYILSEGDARLLKGMLARGDRVKDVAAYYGVECEQIADIASGQKFPHVRAADPAELPEPGVFISLLDRAALAGAIERLNQVREELNALLLQLQSVLPGKRP